MTKETFELVAEHADELIEALDNTAASLETVMVHFGAQMTQTDRTNRWRVVEEAQALVKTLRGKDETESEAPRMITVCKCGSPRVYRDAAMNVNTEEVSTYDSMSCSDCGYDGRHYREVEVPAEFDVTTDMAAAEGAEDPAEILARAELVIEGNHPWIFYGNVLTEFGLDDSFMWTPHTLSPYVEQYLRRHEVKP